MQEQNIGQQQLTKYHCKLFLRFQCAEKPLSVAAGRSAHIHHTVGKISVGHINISLSKYISKGAIDMKFSSDIGNNPSNPYIQRNQNK